MAADAQPYDRVIQAIRALPYEYQAPLLCRYVEDAPYARVAARCRIDTQTVRTLLARGTSMLREQLASMIEEENRS